MVQELLGKGADVNNKSIHGDTPLHLAAKHGHRSVLRQLMDKGADLLCTNNAGKTPEELASARGHDQVAGILRVEAKRRGEREAFAVGQHERRGARHDELTASNAMDCAQDTATEKAPATEGWKGGGGIKVESEAERGAENAPVTDGGDASPEGGGGKATEEPCEGTFSEKTREELLHTLLSKDRELDLLRLEKEEAAKEQEIQRVRLAAWVASSLQAVQERAREEMAAKDVEIEGLLADGEQMRVLQETVERVRGERAESDDELERLRLAERGRADGEETRASQAAQDTARAELVSRTRVLLGQEESARGEMKRLRLENEAQKRGLLACEETARGDVAARDGEISRLRVAGEEETRRMQTLAKAARDVLARARGDLIAKDGEIERLRVAEGEGRRALRGKDDEIERFRLADAMQMKGLRSAEGRVSALQNTARADACIRVSEGDRARVVRDKEAKTRGELQEMVAASDSEVATKDREIARLRRAGEEQTRVLFQVEEKARADLAAKDTAIQGLRRRAFDITQEKVEIEKARLRIAKEKLDVMEELEEKEETLVYMVRADNARMTKVDELAWLALAAGADPSAVHEIKRRKLS